MSDSLPRLPVTSFSVPIRRNRMLFDIINFNYVAVLCAYQRLAAKLAVIPQKGRPNEWETTELFLDAWTIIDRSHIIFTTLKKEKIFSQSELQKIDYKNLMSKVHYLRNRMDHIREHLDNLAKSRKRVMSPFHGVLTAIIPECCTQDSVQTQAMHTVIISGSLGHHTLNFDTLPTDDDLNGIELPSDFVRLHAFEDDLNISQLKRFIVYFEEQSNLNDVRATVSEADYIYLQSRYETHLPIAVKQYRIMA